MASIPSGSKTLFIQAWTPTGWTRDLSYANHGLRVTDTPGADGTSGSDWTTAVAASTGWQWVWPATVSSPGGSPLSVTPTTGELASHIHTLTTGYLTYGFSYLTQYPGGAASGRVGTPIISSNTTSGSAGSAVPDPHTHPLSFNSAPNVSLTVSMRVKYIDAILATRD
jgi:hypothetical protein